MPDGVKQAFVFAHYGDAPPADAREWRLLEATNKVDLPVVVPLSMPPGTRVMRCACWVGTRSEQGPLPARVSRHVNHDDQAMAA